MNPLLPDDPDFPEPAAVEEPLEAASRLPRIPAGRLRLLVLAAALTGTSLACARDAATVFNEVMYHAPGSDVEWIELANLMSADMDLSGWRISGGIDYVFPEGTVIEAGGYVVVAGDPGSVPGALGPWSGRLANGGELIRLHNVSGRIMDELDYRDGGRWPVGADGSGASLARWREGFADSGPEAWVASREIGGTPGAPNFPAGYSRPRGVRISEVSGADDPLFRVELVNEGDLPVSIAGMRIGAVPLPDVTLAPGGMQVFPDTAPGFRPDNANRLFLVDAKASPAVLLDAVAVRPEVRARHGDAMLVPAAESFGEPNVFDLTTSVVINEIMAHAPPFPGRPAQPEVIDSTVLLPLDATWRYLADGSDPGPEWAKSAHSGGAWQEGKALLGFETTPASLPEPLRTAFASTGTTTYYFETDFVVTPDQLGSMTALSIGHVIDDAAVFYLNGVEVVPWRFNLPAGTVGPETPSVEGVGNAQLVGPVVVPLDGLPIVAGINRLSVEVHQQIPTSNDMVCGVRLSAVVSVTPAVPATPVTSNPEEWIELYNRGNEAVDLTDWAFTDGISYQFPTGTVLGPGGYLVVARDAEALRAAWPERAAVILGNFEGSLSNEGERIELRDSRGNPADVARYLPAGWSAGGGSSLELRDPRSDNEHPGAWSASDESSRSEWRTFSWRTTGEQRFGPTTWNEFRLGMLDAGECLIDDVSVRRDPDGANVELIQNGDFEALPEGDRWRFLGNHGASRVIQDPAGGGNRVLHLVASGPTETNHNHVETTFRNDEPIRDNQVYEVSFRARWLAGTTHLNTRAYYQRLAKTWELPLPERHGTPGAPNSRAVANDGPLLSGLAHSPVSPAPGEPVEVSVQAADPDGVASCVLRYRRDGEESFAGVPMTLAGGRWSGTIPAQTAGSLVHFYVEATDEAGASAFGPPRGPDSRALVQWSAPPSGLPPAQKLKLSMLTADRTLLLRIDNRLSNERIPGTLICDGRTIYYDVGIRLQGTAAGRVRDGDPYIGYDIGFPPDNLFRGVHDGIAIDRSARSPVVGRPDEIYVRHSFHRAGIPCALDELCHFTAPVPVHTGTAILQMAAYGGLWVDSQFEGVRGTVFNHDITYDPTSLSEPRNPESLKPPVPFVHVSTDMTDLGDDKEQYRGPFDIRAGKRRDDYSGLITLCKTMGLPSSQLAVRAPEVLDLDEVLRCTALVNLWGIGDTYYTGGLPHNIRLFVPGDGTGIQFLPWDMDFAMSNGATSPLMPSGNNLGRLITSNPAHRRRYLGHLHDLCETVFRTEYMTPWLVRFGAATGHNYQGTTSYITARRNYVKSQLPAVVPFAVLTGGGEPMSTADASVTLEGTAWIDVSTIRLGGSEPDLTWSALTRWRAVIPLAFGPNPLTLTAHARDGTLIATASLTVTRTGTPGAGFEAWRAEHFTPAELADPAVSGPLADPGGAGVANLLRYAFGLGPREAVAEPLPAVGVSGDLLTVEFPRLSSATEVSLVPEGSGDLTTWQPLPGEPLVTPGDNGIGRVRYEVPAQTGLRFFRVRAAGN